MSHNQTPEENAVDIIGDVHGHEEALHDLLSCLGYRRIQGAWRHPRQRLAVFTGDLIDGGPNPRGVLKTVREMVDARVARCVMGNHEFNALLHHTPAPEREGPLRRLTERQLAAHEPTLRNLARPFPDEWRGWLAWFRKLPLWIDGGTWRVIHACWSRAALGFLIEPELNNTVLEACANDGPERRLIDLLLNGPSVTLPGEDHHGESVRRARLRWWEPLAPGCTLRDACINPMPLETGLRPLPEEVRATLTPYSPEAPPLFIGHYGRKDAGTLRLASNVVCVDAGVARGGRLAAWRLQAFPLFASRGDRRFPHHSVSLAG